MKKPFNVSGMHLQWFSDEPTEEMKFEAGETPDDGVEVIIDTGEGAPPEEKPSDLPKTKDELLALIQQSGGKTSDESTSVLLAKQFEQLNANMARMTPAAAGGPPPVDGAAFVKENLFDKPVEALDTYFAQKIQPDVQRIILNNVNTSRRFAYLDPEMKETMKKYGKEVDEYVQNMDMLSKLQNSDPYGIAVKEVEKAHINDIIKDQAMILAKQIVEEAEKAKNTSPSKTFNEIPKRPQPSKTVVRMTKAQEMEEREECAARGMEWTDWIRTTSFQRKYGK